MNTETAIERGQRAIKATDHNPHRRIQAAAVRKICGDISDMSLWRWLKDPDLDFPQPIYIGKRRFWREADVIAWLDARAAQ